MEKITKENFEAYVDVQMSGVTNMFDVKTVGDLSGLEKEQILTIMQSYGELKDKYDEAMELGKTSDCGHYERTRDLENKLDTIKRIADYE